MMAAHNLCSSRYLMRLLLPGLLCLLLVSYALNWWAIRIETRDQHGNNRFRIVARLNLYTDNNIGSSEDLNENKVTNENLLQHPSHSLTSNKEQQKSLPSHSSIQFTTKPPSLISKNQNFEAYHNINYQQQSVNIGTNNSFSSSTEKEDHIFNPGNKDLDTLIKDNIPAVHVDVVNCKAIAARDKAEISKAELYQRSNQKRVIPDKEFIQYASNCQAFIKSRHYATEPLSAEEAEFSIAYSILMFKDVEQVERLLRAIYRPQNYYCVHIDVKSSSVIWQAMRAIVNCFDNVFLSSRSADVQWGWYSVLEPELICMADLWKYKKWK